MLICRAQTRPAILNSRDRAVAVADYTSQCLKPNSAATPEEQVMNRLKHNMAK